MQQPSAHPSGTFDIGGDLTVHRLGFGAMRITGRGIWGGPTDPAEARGVLARLPDLGVDLIDTADSYGPFVSKDLIREVLHPYDGLVIATKGGLTRHGPDAWQPVGRPEYLRQCVLMSLRRLGVERIDLWQLHRIDPLPPRRPVRRHARHARRGPDPPSRPQPGHGRRHRGGARPLPGRDRPEPLPPGATRQRGRLGVLPRARNRLHPMVPARRRQPRPARWTARPDRPTPRRHHGQVALAWLLRRSPVMLPIPGTGRVDHLEENVAAAAVRVGDDDVRALDEVGAAASAESAGR